MALTILNDYQLSWKKHSSRIPSNVDVYIPQKRRFKATCLSTVLKPIFGLKTVNHGSENLEGLLTEVEINLLK